MHISFFMQLIYIYNSYYKDKEITKIYNGKNFIIQLKIKGYDVSLFITT